MAPVKASETQQTLRRLPRTETVTESTAFDEGNTPKGESAVGTAPGDDATNGHLRMDERGERRTAHPSLDRTPVFLREGRAPGAGKGGTLQVEFGQPSTANAAFEEPPRGGEAEGQDSEHTTTFGWRRAETRRFRSATT
jgi:hypothetical protein